MIEVKHLCKSYGSHQAVSDLSFNIERGQIYGFLGPNGAGKSTTMNIMTGCLAASSGSVTIDGYDIYEDAGAAKRLIGYLPEQPPLYLDRSPREYLRFVARAKGLKAGAINDSVDKAMSVTGIGQVGDRLINNLSKGYRQRVGIAQALLGEPETIILDEPTVGLDPKQIIEIRQLIKELGKSHTVILSSHILSEVQAVCGTVLIIAKGSLVACDSPENLEKLFAGGERLRLLADCTGKEAGEIIGRLSGISSLKTEQCPEGCRIELQSDKPGAALRRQLFFAFAGAQRPILEMSGGKSSLEDIFIELTQEKEAEEP